MTKSPPGTYLGQGKRLARAQPMSAPTTGRPPGCTRMKGIFGVETRELVSMVKVVSW